jgi:hypothetical protein
VHHNFVYDLFTIREHTRNLDDGSMVFEKAFKYYLECTLFNSAGYNVVRGVYTTEATLRFYHLLINAIPRDLVYREFDVRLIPSSIRLLECKIHIAGNSMMILYH